MAKPRHRSHLCNQLSPEQLKTFTKRCLFKICNYKVHVTEIELLSLIFYDLATRSHQYKLTREAFSNFFNMIVFIYIRFKGLWGEKLFDRFDRKHDHLITFDEFI